MAGSFAATVEEAQARGREELTLLTAREDLSSYIPSQKLILRLLELEFDVEDAASLGSEVITDGNNDKKIDALYVDNDRQVLVVAQGYWNVSGEGQAKANKASDLTVAASWLTTGSLAGVPIGLKSAVEVARQAIQDGDVREIRFLYCHNVQESAPVKTEVDQAVASARALVQQMTIADGLDILVTGEEIGYTRLGEISLRTSIPIAVKKRITFQVQGGFEEKQGEWKAFVTSVKGSDIRALWTEHGELLTAPNVRDFLGLRKSDSNINNAIQQTAVKDPQNFWIYNNGLTVLVEDFEYKPSRGRQQFSHLEVRGIGVINGAQTTGAIGTIPGASADQLADARVLVRFVTSGNEETLSNVIKFNNTQNKVEAPDFRSKDETQERLRREFAKIPEAEYRGGRRNNAGGTAILRPKNLLADKTVGQALAAFHGKPNLAYNETRLIWGDDGVYSTVFSRATTAPHVVFAYAAMKATEEVKLVLRRTEESELSGAEKNQMDFFRRRGSIPLFVAALGAVAETITGKVINDLHQVSFGQGISPKDAVILWTPIVEALLSAVSMLSPATESELKNPDAVGQALGNLKALVDMTVTSNAALYAEFGSHVVIEANPGS